MRLGGDGVRSSRKGIVRARGVCGMERRRDGCGVGTRCGAETPRAALTEQGVRRHAAGGCQGAGGGAGRGMEGSVSHGSERLELVAGVLIVAVARLVSSEFVSSNSRSLFRLTPDLTCVTH